MKVHRHKCTFRMQKNSNCFYNELIFLTQFHSYQKNTTIKRTKFPFLIIKFIVGQMVCMHDHILRGQKSAVADVHVQKIVI